MISILIPIYNGIEFLPESLKSVINQTFTEWELIIGVNGHEKNSIVYKESVKLADGNPKITVLDLYLITGKANTLNEMVKHCKYDYVALLDVDDIWMNEKLEIQSIYIEDFEYDIIGSRCVYFGDMENTIPKIPIGDITEFDFKSVNPIINSSSIVRKSLCYWRENGLEDYDLWLKMRYNPPTVGKIRFFNCNDILVKHRIHKTSAFNSDGKNNNKVVELLLEYS
jgi:glycosyltransferase involved in cell wall biosynthesis